MSNRVPWIERKFAFDYPVELFPELLERLWGAPPRLEELVRSVPAAALTRSDGAGWTMQENAGHLLDLEALVRGRLDDFDAGAETLRPADMSNRKTHEANHNAAEIESILNAFRREREEIMQRLEALEPARFARNAQHPRLKKPMRLVDMLYFQAEHDVYHLTRISQLARKFKS